MVDTKSQDTTAVASAQLTRAGELKRLDLAITLPQLRETLDDLHTAFSEAGGLLDQQKVRVYLQGESNPRQLETSSRDTRFHNADDKERLFYSDLAALLDDTVTYLQKPDLATREVVIQGLKNPYIDGGNKPVLRLGEDPQNPSLYLENKFHQNRGIIKAVIDQLLAIIVLLIEQPEQKADQAFAYQQQLQSVEARITQNPITAWSGFKPYLQRLSNTKLYEKFLTGEDKVSVIEIRKLTDLFTDTLRRGVESSDQLRLKLNNDQYKKLKSDDIYFGEEADSLTQLLGDEAMKSESDQLKIITIIEFYDKIIPQLLGDKTFAEGPDGVEGTEGPEGGDTDEPIEEKPPELLPVEQVTDQIIADVAAQLLIELGFEEIIPAQAYPELTRQKILELLTKTLKDGNQINVQTYVRNLQRTTTDPATGEQVTTSFYDRETDLFLVNAEFRSGQAGVVSSLVTAFLNFFPIEEDRQQYVQYILAQALAALQQQVEDETAPKYDLENTVVPTNLEALVEDYQRATTPESQEEFLDYWLGLSISERRKLLAQTPELTGLYGAVADRMAAEVFQNYLASQGFDQLDYRSFLAEYSQIREAILDYIIELPLEDLQRLQQPEQRLAFWNELQQRIITQTQPILLPILETAVTQHRDKRLDQLEAEFSALKIDGAAKINLENTVDALLIYSQDPENFIQTLTKERIFRYFGIEVTDDQVEALKNILLDYVKLRRQQLGSVGISENQNFNDQQFFTVRNAVKQFGASQTLVMLTTGYATPPSEFKTPQTDEELEELKKENAVFVWRRQIIEDFWAQLSGEEQELFSPPGQDPSIIPPDFTVADALGQQQTIPQRQSFLSRINPFSRRKAPSSPAQKAFGSVSKATKAAAQATSVATGIATGPAGWAKTAIQLAATKEGRKLLAKITAAVAAFIAFVGRMLFTSWTALAGAGLFTIFSSVIPGGPLVGFVGGTVSGYYLGEMTGLNNALGGPGDFLKRFFGGSGGGPSAPTPYTPSLPFFDTFGGKAVIYGSAGAGVAFVIVEAATQSAFLQPLPTITSEGDISPYVTIEKVVSPSIDFSDYSEGNFPDTDLTYSIRIAPKDDYSITITSMEDVISTNYNSELRPDMSIPDERVLEVDDFFQNNQATETMTLNPGEELILPDYVRTYTEFDSIHSNVSNTFKISFTVDSASDEVVAGEQNAQTGETVCFGECPQFQNGCWPTDGIVYTEPYEPDLNTHKATDAFDISGNAGNPVFAIFEGTAYFYPEGSGVFAGAANGAYGNHVFIASEDAEGKALALIYAHLNSLSMSQGPHEIAAGTYLGDVGNTGNSRGPHLHFEIRTDVADYTLPDHAPNFYHAFNDRFTINQVGPTGLPEPYYTAPNYEAPIAGTRVRPTLLDRITPEGEEEDGLVVFGEKVRTCYQR